MNWREKFAYWEKNSHQLNGKKLNVLLLVRLQWQDSTLIRSSNIFMIHNQLCVVTITFVDPWPNRFVVSFVSLPFRRRMNRNPLKMSERVTRNSSDKTKTVKPHKIFRIWEAKHANTTCECDIQSRHIDNRIDTRITNKQRYREK